MKALQFFIAFLLVSFTTAAADSKAVPPEFTALYAHWDQALVKADLAALNQIYAEDARLTSPEGKLETKAEFLGQVKSGQYQASAPTTTDLQVRVLGDIAVATCEWKATETIQGVKSDGHYRFTDVWVKRDGRWQVMASQGTPVKAGKP